MACNVKSITEESVTCETEAAGAASVESYYVGGNGLTEYFYDEGLGESLTNMSLAVHSESLRNLGEGLGRVWKGYFNAPATTTYWF